MLVDAALSTGDSTVGIWASIQARDQLLWPQGRATLIQRLRALCQEEREGQQYCTHGVTFVLEAKKVNPCT